MAPLTTSEILVLAAELIERQAGELIHDFIGVRIGCCDAIRGVGFYNNLPHHRIAKAQSALWHLRPKERMSQFVYWWMLPGRQTPEDVAERVLALLFAAAIARSEYE